MAQTVTLTMDEKKIIRSVDPLMMSYNVEFAEVTGGTFWREYTPGQIAGTEPFSYVLDENGQPDPMQVYPPVNLYDEKLRSLVKALGPAWVRVSGTWATKTYYDFDGTKVALDHFSYHCYNGISERLEPAMPYAHWKAEEAHTEEFLAVQPLGAKTYAPLRDKYVPGGQMWVSESGDAGGGGDTWASTYLDVLRTLNELGGFSEVTDGIIFHNTLCSSDYRFLKHGTFDPRPNYFAVLLWNRLMGPIVYESGEEIREGAHVYVRSRKDGKAGFACVVINNSLTDETTVLLPKAAEVYALSGENSQMRAPVMTLNGRRLVLSPHGELPDLTPEAVPAGIVTITPGGCTFFVL